MHLVPPLLRVVMLRTGGVLLIRLGGLHLAFTPGIVRFVQQAAAIVGAAGVTLLLAAFWPPPAQAPFAIGPER